MRQIAELMRVDESRISQLHAVALVRLKAHVDTLLRPGQAEPSEARLCRSRRALGPNAGSSVVCQRSQIATGGAAVDAPRRRMTKRETCRLPTFFSPVDVCEN